jgi:hypothetical protein
MSVVGILLERLFGLDTARFRGARVRDGALTVIAVGGSLYAASL